MILSVPAHLFEDKKYHQIYTLHSTYRHTQNYVHGDEIIAIHDASRAPSPMGIILDYEESAFERLKTVLKTIRIETSAITINEVRVSKAEVRLSQHDLRQRVENQGGLTAQDQRILANAIGDELRSSGLSLGLELEKRVVVLKLALTQRQGVVDALAGLIGFGEGLTPSGDDIICGLLAGLLYAGQEEPFEETATLVSALIRNENITSVVSRSFLRFGTQGLFIEALVQLHEKLCANQSVLGLIKQISVLGHRSGTDYLRGILLGIQLGGSDHDLQCD